MTDAADVRQRLAGVAVYADALLKRAAESDANGFMPYADLETIGSELTRLVAAPALDRRQTRDAAMLELAFWSRSWCERVGGRELTEYLLAELASLYLDDGRDETEFVAAVKHAFGTVKKARETLGLAVPGG